MKDILFTYDMQKLQFFHFHISDGLSVHLQELKAAHTATGICLLTVRNM
jgi:hypothetical protein